MHRSRIAILFATILLSACASHVADPVKRPVVIASGGPGGALYPLAVSLEHAYLGDFPDLLVSIQALGSSGSVDALQDGGAQIGFAQADIAYMAYTRGTTTRPRPHTDLRGIAVLWANTAQIAVPDDSSIQSISDLRGKRVAVGSPGTSTEVLARIILKAYGMSYADLHPAFTSFDERVKQMRDGAIDAAFVVTAIPAPVIQELKTNPGIRLIPVDPQRIEAFRGQYPFLRPVVLPSGTYAWQRQPIQAVGIDELLVCRSDLDDTLVYQLTKAFFDALPTLAKVNAVAGTIDLEQAPGTPIPLHPGAARYYREREIGR